MDLPRLFIGSEGTLGITLEAKLKCVPRPQRVITALVYFRDIEHIGQAVNDLLPLEPSALEMMDSNAMDLVGRQSFGIPRETQALLLMEFDHGNLDEKLIEAKEICKHFSLCGPIKIATEKEEQENLWKVRKALYPTLYRYDPLKKPVNFTDDVVVPAPKLSELIRYLEGLFHDLNVPVAIYGHIGNGNAHINPLLNVNNPQDFEKMIILSKEIHQKVIDQYEGSICGEHGDGRVRAEFVRALYGEEVFSLFKKTKEIFDPQNIFNPGVKITDTPFTQNIDFSRLSKACATCGKCNSVCPAYDVIQEESSSARGWFHILTDPQIPDEDSKRAVESCLNCKSCREVCPAGVDVSALVLEKREAYSNGITKYLADLQSKPRLLTRLVKIAGATQPLWDHAFGRWILEKLSVPFLSSLDPKATLSREMILPKFTTQTLREKFQHLTQENGYHHSVAYFHGCAANYFRDGVGEALLKVLNHHGIRPVLPKQQCSGTPIQTYGHKEQLMQSARYNLESLSGYETIITGCASCTLMLKDYPSLFSTSKEVQKAKELSKRVEHITQYLTNHVRLKPFPKPRHTSDQKVTYHASCHLRVAGVSKEPRNLLRKLPGYSFAEMEGANRCAGGAGTFIVKNYDLSQQIFERKKRGVKESGAEVVTTSCPACMIQLQNGLRGDPPVKHIVQLLSDAYQL